MKINSWVSTESYGCISIGRIIDIEILFGNTCIYIDHLLYKNKNNQDTTLPFLLKDSIITELDNESIAKKEANNILAKENIPARFFNLLRLECSGLDYCINGLGFLKKINIHPFDTYLFVEHINFESTDVSNTELPYSLKHTKVKNV